VLRRFGNVGPTIQCLAFSPDGESLATGDESGRINLWDVATGREIDSRSAGAVLSIRYAPDGKTVFTASADGLVRAWDPQNGRPLRKFTTGQRIRYPPDFTADAKIVAVAKERDGIHLWSTSDGKQLCHIPIPKCAEWILALSPDGHSLFAGSYDGKTGRASFWDIPSGKQKLQLPDDLSLAISFAFNPKGNLLAVAGGAVGFIDPANGKLLGIVAPSQGQGGFCFATCVRFCPDGKRLAAGYNDGFVNLIEVATRAQIKELVKPAQGPEHVSGAVAFSPDGKLLAVVDRGNDVRILDVATGAESARFKGHYLPVLSLAFATDGKTLASGSIDSTVLIWEVPTAAPH
jgi:WD40 repeat protein